MASILGTVRQSVSREATLLLVQIGLRRLIHFLDGAFLPEETRAANETTGCCIVTELILVPSVTTNVGVKAERRHGRDAHGLLLRLLLHHTPVIECNVVVAVVEMLQTAERKQWLKRLLRHHIVTVALLWSHPSARYQVCLRLPTRIVAGLLLELLVLVEERAPNRTSRAQ